MAKSSSQLDREIAAALARKRPRSRSYHSTMRDSWDVAMDALLEHDPKRASEIVERMREEHGAITETPQAFLDALEQVPFEVRTRFLELNNKAIAPKQDRAA